jgi:transcriptional regulator with XRE-family HTH domain
MSIDSLKNRLCKRGEQNDNKSDYKDIGNFIKKRRKELNITQDEVTEGICSISYLSKIENNQIIPNNYFVREIMEKLDVDEVVYTNSLREKEYLSRLLNAYYYMNDDEMNGVYQEIKDIEHNYLINLCKLGYTVYFNLDDDNQYVMMLEHLINNMDDFEVGLYLYFAATYFVNNEKYRAAMELIQLSRRLRLYNVKLDGLIYELSYYVKQKLLVKNCSSEDYVNAVTIFTTSNNLKKIINMSLVKVEYLIDENPLKASALLNTIKVSFLDQKNKDRFHYLNAVICKELKRYSDATMHLNKIGGESLHYFQKMVLLLEICNIENDYKMAQEIIEILKDYVPHKSDIRNKVHFHYMTSNTQIERKEYLRDIAIPFSIKVEDYRSLKIYIDDIMEICIENSRYKEAIQYYKKYQKEMNKVKRIIS